MDPALLPEAVLLVGALVLMLWDLTLPPDRKGVLGWGAFGVAVLAFAATWAVPTVRAAGDPAPLLSADCWSSDPLSIFMKRCFAATAAIVFLMSREYVASLRQARGEFWTMSLFALIG